MSEMTNLDKQLLEIANMNWDQFVTLVGKRAIDAAKVCLLRKQDYSQREIMNKLNLPFQQVRYSCETCDSKIKD